MPEKITDDEASELGALFYDIYTDASVAETLCGLRETTKQELRQRLQSILNAACSLQRLLQ